MSEDERLLPAITVRAPPIHRIQSLSRRNVAPSTSSGEFYPQNKIKRRVLVRRPTTDEVPLWLLLIPLFMCVVPVMLVSIYFIIFSTTPINITSTFEHAATSTPWHTMEDDISRKALRALTKSIDMSELGAVPVLVAGLPSFDKYFTRDSVIAGILTADSSLLQRAITIGAAKIGQRADSVTGEEAGKIIHEFPPVTMPNSKSTLYSAGDTSALFLLAIAKYYRLTQEHHQDIREWLITLQPTVAKVMSYIVRHIDHRGLFIETPAFSDAHAYALKVTYWKDSFVWNRAGGQPKYPVVYTLLQAQYIAALRAIETVPTFNISNTRYIGRMVNALNQHLWDDNAGHYVIGRDAEGLITGMTSDTLHALYYLDVDDVPPQRLTDIVNSAQIIETSIGYRSTQVDRSQGLHTAAMYGYHSGTVWPYEQSLIHIAAIKHNLESVRQVAYRIYQLHTFLNHERLKSHRHRARLPSVFPEYFQQTMKRDPLFYDEAVSEDGEWTARGCSPQLWTVASMMSFAHSNEHLLHLHFEGRE